jgi:hypothetical protein
MVKSKLGTGVLLMAKRRVAEIHARKKQKHHTASKSSSKVEISPVYRKKEATPKKPLTKRAASIERFAKVAFQAVSAHYPKAAFTRDDILDLVSGMRLSGQDAWASQTYGINDVTTGTRYRKVCDAVQRLVERKQFVALDWIRLCLPEVSDRLAAEVPLSIAYLPTIRRLVQQHFPPATRLDATAVVDRWEADQHLPHNVKRMTVRSILPVLLREGLLKHGEEYELVVK